MTHARGATEMSEERVWGQADPADVARLSGLELMQAMIEGRLPAPTMARTLGFRLVSVAPGACVFEGEPDAEMLNPLGTVHGGWALTLIDSACGCAGHTLLPAGGRYTTVETKANFCRPILPGAGTVRVEGRVLSPGRQVMLAEASARSADGKLVAHGVSTLIVLAARD